MRFAADDAFSRIGISEWLLEQAQPELERQHTADRTIQQCRVQLAFTNGIHQVFAVHFPGHLHVDAGFH
ncbi:hypothetical protein D3C75_630980 [compost metagenome]